MRVAVPNRNSLFALVLAAAVLATAPAHAAEPRYALQDQPAPDFALKATSGTNVRLSEHRGDVMLLLFWGSRCAQCGTRMGALNRVMDTYRSAGLSAFAVNVDDDQAAAAEFARSHPMSYPVLLDPAKSVAKLYKVDNLPMLLLVDRSGVIRHVHRDPRNSSDGQYLDQVKVLLDE